MNVYDIQTKYSKLATKLSKIQEDEEKYRMIFSSLLEAFNNGAEYAKECFTGDK